MVYGERSVVESHKDWSRRWSLERTRQRLAGLDISRVSSTCPEALMCSSAVHSS